MGEPKALLDLHGRSLIEAHVAALSACCSPVIVVLGAAGDQVTAVLPEGVPIDEGQRGHPVVVVAGPALEALHTAPLHVHLQDVTKVEVDWPDCTLGFNTPAEWAAWRG
jgi:CTP:molybdopterin cytidylyltransferase MocA